jgi:hypothetical protein
VARTSLVWRSHTRTQLRGHADVATCVAFGPDGRAVYTAGLDRTVRRWPAASAVGLPRPNR